MKRLRHIIALLMCAIMLIPMTACQKEESNAVVDITLNEVAHSIFYAPQYTAIELGYFKDENINLNLVTGFGADKVMTALVSGDADIGFMGSESSIYVYQEGSNDYAINFAQLTQRAGNFLVSRNDESNFKWDDLKGKTSAKQAIFTAVRSPISSKPSRMRCWDWQPDPVRSPHTSRSHALCTASILTYRRCVVSHWTNIWDCRLITRSHIIPPFTARSWNRLD